MPDVTMTADELLLSTESVAVARKRDEHDTRDWLFDWPPR